MTPIKTRWSSLPDGIKYYVPPNMPIQVERPHEITEQEVEALIQKRIDQVNRVIKAVEIIRNKEEKKE
jgi:hypothetical protein